MIYTLKIVKQGAADLDGSTQLDLSAAGVVVSRTSAGLIEVTVPDGVALGSVDPGQVLEAAGGETGHTSLVQQISAVSNAPYGGGTTNLIQRQVPNNAVPETLVDLVATGAIVHNGRRIFMPDHLLTFTTDVGGPHEINILMKVSTDEDLAGVAGEPSESGGGQTPQPFPAADLPTPPGGLIYAHNVDEIGGGSVTVFGTNMSDITGVNVTQALNGAPGSPAGVSFTSSNATSATFSVGNGPGGSAWGIEFTTDTGLSIACPSPLFYVPAS